MNRIWNSNYNENFNIRRMPIKDNFKIGEMVYGRVVKNIDVNEAIIKLMNGIEVHAEVDEAISALDKGLLKFIVESFSDNIIQLKLFKSSNEENQNMNNEILRFISSEGLSEKDAEVLKSMLKFDMTLTKENIKEIKSLNQFKERMNSDPKEIDNFIDKYLDSKDIKANTVEGKNIKEKLSEFFRSFNTLSIDDMLLFLENDIEFSNETIESYKNMFTTNEEVDVNFIENKDINRGNKLTENLEASSRSINKNINDVIKSIKDKVESLDIIIPKTIDEDNSLEQGKVLSLDSDDINLEENYKTSLQNSNGDLTKEVIKSLLRDRNIDITYRELKIISNIIENDMNNPMDKESLEKVFSNLLNKEIILSEKEYENIKKLFSGKLSKSEHLDFEIAKLPKEIIKEAIINKSEEGKQVIKNVLELMSEGLDSAELLGIIKNNISDIKLFNKLSDQYYYVDVPLNFNEKEYPCKIIIKDKRKEGKAIDSKNVKLVLTLKTSNLGVIDSYVQVLNRNISIKLSCNEQYMKIFEISKNKLESIVGSLGFNVKVEIEKKQEEVSLATCREFFGDNNVAGIDIKV